MTSRAIPRPVTKLKAATVAMFAGAVLSLAACGGGTSTPEVPEDTFAPVTSDSAIADGEVSVRELVPLLTRYGVGPNQIGIDITFAPILFFEVTGLKVPQEALDQPTLLFILQENIHEGDLLSDEPSPAFLLSDNGERLSPYLTVVTAEDPHHRVVRLLFPMLEETDHLRLVVPFADGTVSVANTFDWQLPIDVSAAETEREG